MLLDQLMNDEDEDGSVRDAWRCFRELCAFAADYSEMSIVKLIIN